MENRVFIAGAGPVGLTAAACLLAKGVPVTVFEAAATLSGQSRASTFHPSTLDMLDDLGVAKELRSRGLEAPFVQYRSRADGLLARFDFGDISDLTRHPFRLQCEQWQLTHIYLDKLQNDPNFEIVFSSAVNDVSQTADGVTVVLQGDGKTTERTGRWLIGADGASSAVRQSLGLDFDGFTWPERFLVLSTPDDLTQVVENLDAVTYVSDPVQWNFYLRIPGAWRVMFPVPADMSDEALSDPAYGVQLLDRIMPEAGSLQIQHRTLYRVHQRVASAYRSGRVLLAGDAAHINNPLGGMGMNGGIHDSVNLAQKLVSVWRGESGDEALDLYERQRRQVTLDFVQTQTIQNKRDLEEADYGAHREKMAERMQDRKLRREFLKRIAMMSTLERAAKIR